MLDAMKMTGEEQLAAIKESTGLELSGDQLVALKGVVLDPWLAYHINRENSLQRQLGQIQDWADRVQNVSFCWQCQRAFEKADSEEEEADDE